MSKNLSIFALLLVGLPMLTTGRPTDCPREFHHDARAKGCYKVIPVTMNWWAASGACQNMDAHLVTIKSRAEQDAVVAVTHTISNYQRDMCANSVPNGIPASYSNRYGGYWTAGQRVNPHTNSPFVWRSNSNSPNSYKSFEYTAWGAGEPSNGGNYEGCVHLWSGPHHPENVWNDSNCYNQMCAICEIDILA